ncbi:hypothetical protein ABZP36_021533 [Zizania latifolia]
MYLSSAICKGSPLSANPPLPRRPALSFWRKRRGANDDEFKKAYHRLAMKYHPDKNPSPQADYLFKQVSEAYDVLGNSQKRAIYDQYGEEGLKAGVSPPFASSHGSPSAHGFRFNPRTAEEIFSEIFGGALGNVGGAISITILTRIQADGCYHIIPNLTADALLLGASSSVRFYDLEEVLLHWCKLVRRLIQVAGLTHPPRLLSCDSPDAAASSAAAAAPHPAPLARNSYTDTAAQQFK